MSELVLAMLRVQYCMFLRVLMCFCICFVCFCLFLCVFARFLQGFARFRVFFDVFVLSERSWALVGHSWAFLGRSWALLGRSWALLGRSWGGLGRSWPVLVALGGAVLLCGLCGRWGSRPSEPREARRAKAEALMIIYFHVVNCLWLLGWFGDVLSCLGCMLLCIFVLESFSRCGRPRARFVELIRCSRRWACFGELKPSFPFSAAQVLSGHFRGCSRLFGGVSGGHF